MPPDVKLPAPPQLNDGWSVSSPEDAGINSEQLIALQNLIDSWQGHGMNAILIVKDNKLIFEKYYAGHVFDFNIPALTTQQLDYDAKTLHFLASQSKSVTSLLYGIAKDNGYVQSVTENIYPYFSPQYSTLFTGGKENITVRQLLTMSSGLSWNENPAGTGDVYYLFRTADPVNFLLSLPLEATPGSRFHYNSGGPNILGEIIRKKSGMTLRRFALEYLFTPLGISQFDWKSIRGDCIFASGGLFLAPRDMAKIGQLCLNGGSWNGKTIVSKEWIDESTKNWIYPTEFGMGNGYGYQWWLNDYEANGKTWHSYFAAGWGEQLMFVVPTKNMVVLFFAEYYSYPPPLPFTALLRNYILPACEEPL